MKQDSALKTLLVATLLCIVCSVLVSTAAVEFKAMQEKNKKLDIQKNILRAAGLLTDGKVSEREIARTFRNIETQLIDLTSGEVVAASSSDDPELLRKLNLYDARKAAKNPVLSYSIPTEQDLGKIKRRGKLGKVYLVKGPGGMTRTLIIPINGKGLWSTLYGFLALESDAKTVVGIGFYEHGETPGLGGEIDNAKWQTSWRGKQVLDSDMTPVLRVLKGPVNQNSPDAMKQIDGLSGATITSRGVENLVNYWLGSNGYGKFLANFQRSRDEY